MSPANDDNDERTQQGLAAMDQITDAWAEEIGLDGFVARALAGDLPVSLQERVEAIARQCFAEGALRGFYAGQDMPSPRHAEGSGHADPA